jgi:putative RecB family exonuclease
MSDIKHWSHSQVETLLRCGKSYELSRLLNAPKQPTVWSPAGTALHEVADLIARGDAGDIYTTWVRVFDEHVTRQATETQSDPQFWRKAGRVTKDKPEKEDVNWWRGEGSRQLIMYKNWLDSSGYKVAKLSDGTLLSEHETTTRFGNIEVRGFCDVVLKAPDGSHIVMDLKSGTRVPDKLTQLGLYRVALQQNHPDDRLKINTGCFFMTRKGEPTEPVDLSKYTTDYFTSIFSMAESIREAKAFVPAPGDACRICDVSDACYTVGGTDSWKYDSLNPQFIGWEVTPS